MIVYINIIFSIIIMNKKFKGIAFVLKSWSFFSHLVTIFHKG